MMPFMLRRTAGCRCWRLCTLPIGRSTRQYTCCFDRASPKADECTVAEPEILTNIYIETRKLYELSHVLFRQDCQAAWRIELSHLQSLPELLPGCISSQEENN